MSEKLTIKYKPEQISDREFIQLHFTSNKEIIEPIKSKTPARWSPTIRCWMSEIGTKKTGPRKRGYPSGLKQSFATHHLERRTDLRFIQNFWGHESSKITEIDTHVSRSDFARFKNPIDDLFDSG